MKRAVSLLLLACAAALAFAAAASDQFSTVPAKKTNTETSQQSPEQEAFGTRNESARSLHDAAVAADKTRASIRKEFLQTKLHYSSPGGPRDHNAPPNNTILSYTPRDVRAQVTGEYDYGVTDTGSSYINIPIWVPQGRAGVQPSLSLKYSSSQGNGLLGVGWSLTGISNISRCMKNGYDNPTVVGPVTWTDTDALCLDGEQLVLVSGEAGADGAVYRTRHDQMARIVVQGHDALGPLSFEVRLKNHMTLYYGGDAKSRTELPVTTARGRDDFPPVTTQITTQQKRMTWWLSKQEDRSGNFAVYAYSNGFNSAWVEPLIQTIKYTGSKTNPNTQRTVSFGYEPRPDTSEKYFAGALIKQTVRLATIEMYAPQPSTQELVRKYYLNYNTAPLTARSRLNRIRECDSDLSTASSTKTPVCKDGRFQYEDANPGFDDIDTGMSWSSEVYTRPELADFNGDGLDDMFYTDGAGKRHVRLSNGTGFGNEQDAVNDSALLDYDGDSRIDALVLDYPESSIWRSGTSGLFNELLAQSKILTIPGGGSDNYYNPTTGNFNTKQVSQIEPVDLDGDRRPDLLVHLGVWPNSFDDGFFDPIGQWGVLWNSGPTIFPAPQTLPISMRPDHHFVDVNGDGRAEILTQLEQHKTLSAVSVNGRSDVQSFQTAIPPKTYYIFFDANGDGLSDILVDPHPSLNNPQSDIDGTFWLSTGDGFINPSPNPLWPADEADSGNSRRVIDYYLDGKQEILYQNYQRYVPDQSSPLTIIRIKNDGSYGWEQLPTPPHAVSSVSPEVLDVNGDGLDDILLIYWDGHTHLWIRRGKKPDLLTAASGTLGTSIQFSYKALSSANESARTDARSDCQYPVGCVNSKLWVVDRLSVDDGLGKGTYRVYGHTFLDGRSDLLGAGFLGFKTHIMNDFTLSRTITRTFDLSPGQDYRYPFAHVPSKIEEITSIAPGLENRRETDFENAVRITDTAIQAPFYPFFIYQKSISRTAREVSGTSSQLISRDIQTSKVDMFGNITEATDTWPDLNIKLASSISYNYQIAAWLVDCPRLLTINSTDGAGNTKTRRTAFDFDSSGLLRNHWTEPGLATATGYQPLPTQQDGVRTLYSTIDYTTEGLPELITLTDTVTGEVRSVGTIYDAGESMFPTVTIDALGHTVTQVVNPALGVFASATDENGNTDTYQYDGFGRLRSVHSYVGADSKLNYTAPASGPNLLEILQTTAGQGSLKTTLDSLNRPVLRQQSNRQDGKIVDERTNYDSAGRIFGVSRPYFDASEQPVYTTYQYDNLSRRLVTNYPDGSNQRFIFHGRSVDLWNRAGNQSEVEFDTAGRITRRSQFEQPASSALPNPKHEDLLFRYGPFDVISNILGPVGFKFEQQTDRFGRAIAVSNQDAGASSITYNAFGEPIQLSKGGIWKAGKVKGGQSTEFMYDLDGRVVEEDSVDGITKFTWDTADHGVGRIATALSPDNILTEYGYDSLSRLSSQLTVVSNHKYVATQHYDQFGRPSAVTYPEAPNEPPFTIESVYSPGGQLVALRRSGGGTALWTLVTSDASEQFSTTEFGNGIRTQVTGLPNGILTGIRSGKPGSQAQDLQYEFVAGRLMVRRDHAIQSYEQFDYDGFDRLSHWLWKNNENQRAVKWDYDHLGNIRTTTIEEGPGSTINYQYGVPSNRPHALVATQQGHYSYDDLGRQIEAPDRTVTYTDFDLPKTITTSNEKLTYSYDVVGSRVLEESSANKSTISIGRLYDRRTTQSTYEHRFHIYLGDQPIADYVVTQEPNFTNTHKILYLHTDYLGSINAITDSNGKVLDHLAYEPYGVRVKTSNAFTKLTDNPEDVTKGFAGQRHDTSTSLIDFKGRILDASTGHFLTPDPILSDPLSVQGRNPYSYVENDPINWTDPTGFDGEEISPDLDVVSGADLSYEAYWTAKYGSQFHSTVVGNGVAGVTGPLSETPSVNAGDTGDRGSLSPEPFAQLQSLPRVVNTTIGPVCGYGGVCRRIGSIPYDPSDPNACREGYQCHLHSGKAEAEDPATKVLLLLYGLQAINLGVGAVVEGVGFTVPELGPAIVEESTGVSGGASAEVAEALGAEAQAAEGTLLKAVGRENAKLVRAVLKNREPLSTLSPQTARAAANFYRDVATRTTGKLASEAAQYNIARAEFLEGARATLPPTLPEFIKTLSR